MARPLPAIVLDPEELAPILARLIEEDHGFATPCLVWTGRTQTNGYGQVEVRGHPRVVHRLLWEQDHGPVPPGLVLDHLCEVEACARHLEPVTQGKNISRGRGRHLPGRSTTIIPGRPFDSGDPPMTATDTPRKTRSGSRAPVNPKTKAQRLLRARELTDRIDARQAEVEDLSAQRNVVLAQLRGTDGLTYREIAASVGKSEQAIHKALKKAYVEIDHPNPG